MRNLEVDSTYHPEFEISFGMVLLMLTTTKHQDVL